MSAVQSFSGHDQERTRVEIKGRGVGRTTKVHTAGEGGNLQSGFRFIFLVNDQL